MKIALDATNNPRSNKYFENSGHLLRRRAFATHLAAGGMRNLCGLLCLGILNGSPAALGQAVGARRRVDVSSAGNNLKSWHADDSLGLWNWRDRFERLLAEAVTVPLPARISLERPLLFFHLPKTAGSSLREVLSSALGRLPSLFPCKNCACVCDPLAEGVRNRTSCDVAILGHLTPFEVTSVPGQQMMLAMFLRLDRGMYGAPRCHRQWDHDGLTEQHALWRVLDRSLCITVLRHPVQRAISHYYEFVYGTKSNLTFSMFFKEFGMKALATISGFGPLYAEWLGGGSADRAKKVMETCVTGIQERFPELLTTSSRFLPIDLTSALAAGHEHAHGWIGVNASFERVITPHLLHLFPGEYELWAHASAVATEQYQMALRYTRLRPTTTVGS